MVVIEWVVAGIDPCCFYLHRSVPCALLVLSLFNALLQAIAILDVISSIDLFSKLSLTHGREVLQIAKRGKYQVGEVVNTYKSWSEKFYVVAAGVVEARVNVGEDGTYDDSED